MARTPLRYPGGKSRAVKKILPYIPENCKELCAPFFGGGSVELAVADRGATVYGYDVFEPVVWFWKALLDTPEELASLADSYRKYHSDFILEETKTLPKRKVKGLLKEDFVKFRNYLRKEKNFSLENAAKFYAINKSSFSGATFSGGYSKRAAYARFTDGSIKKIKNYEVNNLTVEHASFEQSILKHPNAFLYCDPPYLLEKGKNNLYGDKGSTHQGFNHDLLHEILSNRDKWVLSYNDSPKVRKMYSKHEIIKLSWSYGMNDKNKRDKDSSSEILIIA